MTQDKIFYFMMQLQKNANQNDSKCDLYIYENTKYVVNDLF